MNSGYIRAKEKVKVEYDDSPDEVELEMERSGEVTRRGRNAGFSVGQIQNSKAARVYVFGQNDVFESDDRDIEMSEIRSRKAARNNGGSGTYSANSTESDNIFFERLISEEDTLQNISLQYGCPVAELKRINKLISDQDFFALRKIKVPIKRYGLLTEMLEQEKKNNASLSTSISISKSAANGAASIERTGYIANDIADESDNCLSDPEMEHLLIRTLSIRDNINSQTKQAEEFLDSMDRDLKSIRQSTKSYKTSLQDVTHTLTDKRIRPLQKRTNILDCNCSWRQIVCVAIFVGIFVPLGFLAAAYCYRNDCHMS